MTIEAPPRPPRVEPQELEALIEEARRRAQRRRLIGLACALVVFAVGGVTAGVYFRGHGGSTAVKSRPGRPPTMTAGQPAELLLFGSRERNVIYSIRPDGTHLQRLTRTGNQNFALSPDGARIAFVRGERHIALFVYDLRSMRARRITPWRMTGPVVIQPRWALGGRRIVFGSCAGQADGFGCAVLTIRPDGSGVQDLTHGLKANPYAVVSPNGRWIAFSTAPFPSGFGQLMGGGGHLYAERLDGSHRRLLASGASSGALSWSPTGLITFERTHGGLDAVSLSGHRRRFERAAPFPHWAPQGSRFAVGHQGELFVGRASVRRLNRLSQPGTSADPYSVAWSPDGSRIAYTEERAHAHTSIVVVNAGTGHVDSVIPFKRPTWVVAWSPR